MAEPTRVLLDQLLDRAGAVTSTMPASTVAMVDQIQAGIRDRCGEFGIDLTDTVEQATVVRTLAVLVDEAEACLTHRGRAAGVAAQAARLPFSARTGVVAVAHACSLLIHAVDDATRRPPDPFQPIDTPCWLWSGWHNDAGYAYVRWEGRDQPAHRVIHELVTGESLDGFDRDHLCRFVACVRPDHGERVTHEENQRRLSEHQTSCRRAGHDWTDPRNVRTRRDGRRWCAECDRIDQRERRARRTS